MKLKRSWIALFWVLTGIYAVAAVTGEIALRNTGAGVAVLAGALLFWLAGVLFLSRRMRCPSCGRGLLREALRSAQDNVFFCSNCGQRIEFE